MKYIKTFESFKSDKETSDIVLEKASKELSATDAAKEINDKFKKLGIKAKVTASDLEAAEANRHSDKVYDLDLIRINPNDLGAFAPVFKNIKLEPTVVYGQANNAMVLLLKYSWEHSTGSNGYTIRDTYANGKWLGY